MRSLLIPLLIATAGCGDSLHGPALAAYVPSYPVPVDPVLESRWFAGDRDGTVAPCEVGRVGVIGTDDLWGSGVPLVDAPVAPTPAAWAEVDGYRWSLAQFLVVEEAGDQRRTSPADPLDGVWGVSTFKVMLVAEGDLDGITEELQIQPDSEGRGIQPGVQWLLHVDPTDLADFPGTLVVPDEDDSLARPEVMPVAHLGLASLAQRSVLLGGGPGGLTFEDCP